MPEESTARRDGCAPGITAVLIDRAKHITEFVGKFVVRFRLDQVSGEYSARFFSSVAELSGHPSGALIPGHRVMVVPVSGDDE